MFTLVRPRWLKRRNPCALQMLANTGSAIARRRLYCRRPCSVSILRFILSLAFSTEHGREMMARRFATVEPVFGNLRSNKRLNRFTLRGRAKVDGQWKLYCLVHNIEKLANNGYAT